MQVQNAFSTLKPSKIS